MRSHRQMNQGLRPGEMMTMLTELQTNHRIEDWVFDFGAKPHRWAVKVEGRDLLWWSSAEVEAFLVGSKLGG